MNKQQLLDNLQKKITTDNVCPQLSGQATQLVFGAGNPDAEIVFIGEAPGKKEDQTGMPFVGASGKFLDEMLQSINLSRKDIYITNIVKYRPQNNRDPLVEEKSEFLPYLQSQLDIIQPKIVITLGRHSMNCFLPDLQISKVHGQVIKGLKYIIMPLYHPAAALYNGAMRQILMADFSRIPQIIEEN